MCAYILVQSLNPESFFVEKGLRPAGFLIQMDVEDDGVPRFKRARVAEHAVYPEASAPRQQALGGSAHRPTKVLPFLGLLAFLFIFYFFVFLR